MSERRPLAQAIKTAQERGCPLSEVFLMQEILEGGLPRASLLGAMEGRLAVMRSSWTRGLESPQHSASGLVRGGGHLLGQMATSGQSLISPSFTRLIAGAMAIGEVNACMGRIVAAPTAGSCGVLPATLFTCAETRGFSTAQLVLALFTAGGIGAAIDQLATLSGAEGGCQAEVGAASAMAAGALVELCGGGPERVGAAVVFALSNLLGLVCDPVLGLVEVPCTARNAMGAANAVLAAEMALAGVACHFAPDAVIEVMGKVGRRIPEELRETARGGLAAIYVPPAADAC